MENLRACERCAAPITWALTGLDGLCPSCLLAQAMSLDQAGPLDTLSDSYAIVNVLGDSARATTWLARSLQLPHRAVALKILKGRHETAAWRARMDTHLTIYGGLSRPSIASLVDAGLDDAGRPFLVSEFVAGRTLSMECTRSRLTPCEVLRLFAATCRALQHAHDRGLSHGHLVDDNVRITRSRETSGPKVMDFGLQDLASQPQDIQADCRALIDLLQLTVTARLGASRSPGVWESLRRRLAGAVSPAEPASAFAAAAEHLALERDATYATD